MYTSRILGDICPCVLTRIRRMSQANLPCCLRARRQFRFSHPVDICARRDLSLRRNIWKNLTPSLHRRSYCIRRDPSAASASNLCNDSKLQTSPRRITGAQKHAWWQAALRARSEAQVRLSLIGLLSGWNLQEIKQGHAHRGKNKQKNRGASS